MPLLFHIIYTRGTVATLLFLAESLLRWSDCRLRLVANGCGMAELSLLQQFAAPEPRVTWEALPGERIMAHGDALNYLQARCTEEFFCFLDSDIYATGPFLQDFTAPLNHCAAVFSGAAADEPPAGCRFAPPEKVMSGRFSHTADGLCLGSTYFAIYNQTRLNALWASSGLSFRKYRWDEIPAACQQQLAAAGLRCEIYESGKLPNLLLQWAGASVSYRPGTDLRHLGGISRYLSLRHLAWDTRLKLRLKLMLQGEFRPLLQWGLSPSALYWGRALEALRQGRPLPAPPAAVPQGLPRQVALELAALHSAARGAGGPAS